MRALDRTNKIFAIVLLVVGVATIGLQVPALAEQKKIQQDFTASADLSAISIAIDSKVSTDNDLPNSLKDLKLDKDVQSRLSQYEYNKKSDKYELCAVFKTKAGNKQDAAKADTELDRTSFSAVYVDFYSHDAGRVCFEKETYLYGSLDSNLDFFNFNGSGSGSGSTAPSSGMGSSADDAHKKTDINTIHALLEEYFNEHDSYPTAAQLIDEAWIEQNMGNPDKEAFKGPNGEQFFQVYSYINIPGTCANTAAAPCTAYSLSAQLGNGEYYTKPSLN